MKLKELKPKYNRIQVVFDEKDKNGNPIEDNFAYYLEKGILFDLTYEEAVKKFGNKIVIDYGYIDLTKATYVVLK